MNEVTIEQIKDSIRDRLYEIEHDETLFGPPLEGYRFGLMWVLVEIDRLGLPEPEMRPLVRIGVEAPGEGDWQLRPAEAGGEID